MKRVYNCMICNLEFKASKNTNIKTCIFCRKIRQKHSQKEWNNRKQILHSLINDNCKILKLVSTNGSVYIKLNSLITYQLGNSITQINSKYNYTNFIKEITQLLDEDMKFIESLNNFNVKLERFGRNINKVQDF